MSQNYWRPDLLHKAAQLITDAARNLYTEYPHSQVRPCLETLPAVRSMIAAAQDCIERAQPNPSAERPFGAPRS